jgi:UDP-N-acetylmuramate dehydrogenase
MNSRVTDLTKSFTSAVSVEIHPDFPLSKLTSWRIGGKADWLIEPGDMPGLIHTVHVLQNEGIKWMVLGGGTNLLFCDAGYRGAVIRLGSGFESVTSSRNHISSGASLSLNKVIQFAHKKSLTGLEPLSGIPGSVGGSIYVNAGAHGINILDLVINIEGINSQGEIFEIKDPDSQYRSGVCNASQIITQVTMQLTPGHSKDIETRMNQYMDQRARTQPLGAASAGCTFKNPTGEGAGRLIDSLNLKGFRIGGAEISSKHANFIINRGDASAEDVVRLILHVQNEVKQRYGIQLKTEVGIFDESGVTRLVGNEQ